MKCFASQKHKDLDKKSSQTKVAEDSQKAVLPSLKDSLIAKLMEDEDFKKYLEEPVIQYYVLILHEILHDLSITNEYNKEGRVEVANKKLANLRSKGLEYNVVFEDFCRCILDHLQ